MKQKIGKFAGVLILAALLYVATSFQATGFINQALAACSGTGCDGQFPDSSGCSTNGTITNLVTLYPTYTTVQMRHSSGCNTSWTRTTVTSTPYGPVYITATLTFNVAPWNYPISSGGPLGLNSAVFTQQRYSAKPFKACGAGSLTGYIMTPYLSFCSNNIN
jgi:hypothetical protein